MEKWINTLESWPNLGAGSHTQTTTKLHTYVTTLCEIVKEQQRKIGELTAKVEQLTPKVMDWSKFGENKEVDAYIVNAVKRTESETERRAKNLTISGITAKTDGNESEKVEHDKKMVEKIVEAIGCGGKIIKRMTRIGKARELKPQLILVEMDNNEDQKQILRNASRLKDCGNYKNIFINKDMCKSELDAAKMLRSQCYKLNQELEKQDELKRKYGTTVEGGKTVEFFYGIRSQRICKIDRFTKRFVRTEDIRA